MGFVSRIATEKLAATGKAKMMPKITPHMAQLISAKKPNQGRLRRLAMKKGTRPHSVPVKRPPRIKGSR